MHLEKILKFKYWIKCYLDDKAMIERKRSYFLSFLSIRFSPSTLSLCYPPPPLLNLQKLYFARSLHSTQQSMSAIFLRKSNHERGKEWGQWLINMSLEAAMYSCFHLWHVGPSVIRSYTTLAVWCFSASPECLLPKFPLVTSFSCWKLNFFVVEKPSVQTEGCQLCIFTLLPNH